MLEPRWISMRVYPTHLILISDVIEVLLETKGLLSEQFRTCLAKVDDNVSTPAVKLVKDD